MSALEKLLTEPIQEQAQHSRAQNAPPSIFFLLKGEDVPRYSNKNFIDQVRSNFLFLQRKLAASPSNVQRAIKIDSRIKHGNPVFTGTRVPLYFVVEELASGSTIEEIVESYPTLNIEQINAGLEFIVSLARIYND